MFEKNPKVIVNKKQVVDLLNRGVSEVYPDKKKLEKALLSGKRLKVYAGADATGPSIHLGHTKIFIMLEKLRQMGHEVIVLFGDFTAQIGDPTDKGAARIRLTKDDVQKNLTNWKDQISKIINLKDKDNPAKIVFNSEWLEKMNFSEVIDLASNFTVQQMIERDMFQKRLEERKPIYVHEFFYPLMQGYDSVHLDVDLEIGGTDQTFNMLTGRTLQSKLKQKEKFVLTVGLLEDPKTGKKLMSKSEGDAVWLDDSANDMYGKVMSLTDDAIIPMLIGTTLLSMKEIQKIKTDLEDGKNPKEAKMILADQIVKIYHGDASAKEARENFEKTFSQKTDLPDDVMKVGFSIGKKLSEILIETEMVKSKTEFRRLLSEGAIKDLVNNKNIDDPDYVIENNVDLKIGKRRFLRVIAIA